MVFYSTREGEKYHRPGGGGGMPLAGGQTLKIKLVQSIVLQSTCTKTAFFWVLATFGGKKLLKNAVFLRSAVS